jgi:hypothetical protein
MRKTILALSLTLLSLRAFAVDVTVTTPAVNAQVTSPFTINATSATCSGVATAAMSYWLDSSSETAVQGQAIAATVVPAALGPHTLHVKCSGAGGVTSSTAVLITVYDIQYSLEGLSSWACQHDTATGATSSGTTALETTSYRRFDITYSSYGGELCHVTWAHDSAVHAFIYAADVMLDTPATVANVELDMNQVTANGETVIYGFQCDGWSGTWDYSANSGTAAAPHSTWIHSLPCPKPSTWGAGVWHHIQIGYRRDDVGNVLYVYVSFDGVLQNINETTFSSFALNWAAGTLLTNFQVDGLLPGQNVTATAHLRNLSIKRY